MSRTTTNHAFNGGSLSWLERFPYKEDVGGSSPSAPTTGVLMVFW